MSLSAHLAVQRNAFSTAVAAPKVCDGATSSSLAERISHAGVFAAQQGSQTFVLIPSICGHILNIRAAAAGSASVPPAAIPLTAEINYPSTVHALGEAIVSAVAPSLTTLPTTGIAGVTASNNNDVSDTPFFDSDNLRNQLVEKTRTTIDEITTPQPRDVLSDFAGAIETTSGRIGDDNTKVVYGFKRAPTAPDQYRLVSAALRLNCINASDSNQGWFEAVRIRPSWTPQGTMTYNLSSPGDVIIGPEPNYWESGILRSANWANDPSYVTGKLRDLGRHTFYLQTTGKERNFHKWPIGVKSESFDSFQEQPFGFDPNFDCIAIRIRSAPSENTALTQTIHYHVTKNWETIYDSHSFQSRFHTSTIANKNAVEYADRQMSRDPKASMIRSASSYSYRY